MKRKVIKYVIIGILIMVAGILSFFVYQSYAYFKVNYSGNIINATVGHFGSYEYAYTSSAQEFIAPKTGYYEVELWGASGGDTSEGYIGGKGGYSNGTIYLTKNEKIYLYVGEKGTSIASGTLAGKFNGGGLINVNFRCTENFGTGGGATDIRIVNGTWNDSTSLRSRIMVAGGGGGSSFHFCNANDYGKDNGGAGGGLVGVSATGTTVFSRVWAKGGTQISGGTGGTINGESGTTNGSFGTGASYTRLNVAQASGGGGYYGGGLGMFSGGAGGSAYISGYAGVNSVQQTGGTAAQPLHTNNTIHYSGKYFLKGSMEAGVNTGHGKAKITYLYSDLPQKTNTKLNNVRYIKACNNGTSGDQGVRWSEIQAIKDGVNIAKGKGVSGTTATVSGHNYASITDGNIDTHATANTPPLQCVTVDLGAIYNLDEIAVWGGFWQYTTGHIEGQIVGHIERDNVLSVGQTNVGGTGSLATVLHNYPGVTGYIQTSQGKRYSAWD